MQFHNTFTVKQHTDWDFNICYKTFASVFMCKSSRSVWIYLIYCSHFVWLITLFIIYHIIFLCGLVTFPNCSTCAERTITTLSHVGGDHTEVNMKFSDFKKCQYEVFVCDCRHVLYQKPHFHSFILKINTFILITFTSSHFHTNIPVSVP